jgi:hypothetical protein
MIHNPVDAKDIPGIELSHFFLRYRGRIAFERYHGSPDDHVDTFIVHKRIFFNTILAAFAISSSKSG